jgi:hypothetical protein
VTEIRSMCVFPLLEEGEGGKKRKVLFCVYLVSQSVRAPHSCTRMRARQSSSQRKEERCLCELAEVQRECVIGTTAFDRVL